MSDDEQAIRELVATWHRATAAGDLQRILSLMTEDAVFLTPGRPPMRGKDAFAAGFRTLIQTHRIESTGTIKEIHIAGDWAHFWAQLSVTTTPLNGPPTRRSGPTLTIVRKQADGVWVLARDANMLTVETPA
ncbi:MAG: SgcJ/EcaC family oxidoreductase [Candidatus Eisenbacteria bacterium]|uniref:SgcJ/EcaC family oxidoreductase n=1 Tax=Eiseniibacteriota bacterium TaxID=2212470 RepID=A0A538TL72_UNCEI|nr:MAG: SgcJ/EcaC family oxidoreductase [Candidatus Eisenbacteria bacterium]